MNPLRNRSLLFALGITFLFGCHKDDDVTGPHTILTLQVDAGYTLDTEDNWIFATDDNGEVLDVKPYAGGETVTLVSDKAGDKINVTFFVHHEAASKSSTFSTYAHISSGTVLHFIKPKAASHESLPGTATFMISNFNYLLSSVEFSNGDSYGASTTITSSEMDSEVSYYGIPSDFLLSGYRAGVPVFNWAKGVKDGDVIKRDFQADFVAFPHQRKLDFEGTNSATLFGATANANFLVLNTYQLAGTAYATDQPVIGYIDDFVSYDLIVTNTKANGSVMYLNNGAIDLSFTMPTFAFSLNNNSLQNLSFNLSEDYTYYYSGWAYTQDSENIRWNVTAPTGVTLKGLSIPQEIATKYSQIDVSKFKHSSINFTKIVEGASYPAGMPGVTTTSDDKTQKLYTYSPKL